MRCKRKSEVKQLYLSSFPKEERMPFFLMKIMSCLWNTEFLVFYDGDTLCGMAYLATIGRQTFVMFFAVDPHLRSRGYGGEILRKIGERHPKSRIVVSIEPCLQGSEDLEQRMRRKNFYLRNGFAETGYMMKLAGQKQEILIKNGVFNRGKFIGFFALYSFCTVIPRIWKIGS